MKKEMILQNFESLIENLSIDLRYEKCDFIGGFCQVNRKKMLIINNKLSIEKKIGIIAKELNQLNLEQYYIRPVLRNIIESRK